MNTSKHLAARLARGDYEIDPKQVAEAMLKRRGRGLLMLVPSPREAAAPGFPQHNPGPGLGAA